MAFVAVVVVLAAEPMAIEFVPAASALVAAVVPEPIAMLVLEPEP